LGKFAGKTDLKVNVAVRRVCAPAIALVAGGCMWGCAKPLPPVVPESKSQLVYIFPGIEGNEWTVQGPISAFRDAGVEAYFYVFDWQRLLNPFGNLMDYDGNVERARRVARQLQDVRALRPDVTIDLVGYSGGGGLAVLVCEQLPERFGLRNVVLVQPALSPECDLGPALRRINGRIINFYSPGDWFMLGLGTSFFGTIDREFRASAGHVGFEVAKAVANEADRSRVQQIEYSMDMLEEGHVGEHFSIFVYAWNKRYVAPYLAPDETARMSLRRLTTTQPAASSNGAGSGE
jgi:pimeloyl-ACP methyl ester carboxylesterase